MQGSKPVECEVLNVIQAAGIWPDCDDKTQLLQAIKQLTVSSLPSRQYFTESAEFIVPEGVENIRVTVAGAGGGGGLNGNPPSQKSGDGSASSVTYGSLGIIAEGGEGGWSAKIDEDGASSGVASNGDLNLAGQGAVGGNGSVSVLGQTGGPGGNGGLAIKDLSVTAGEVFEIVVGKGGVATHQGLELNVGQDGYVILEWV
ncbi:hypothetical protein [Thalassospira alkalitolerans]|uniref:hypothetical protein n=1 Tax=Thalassospira alkalitolerans TaxID=1293890 RepID=UPI003AA86EBD